MKDYNYREKYYIDNTPWKRKLEVDSIPKFNTNYTDIIVFNFDLTYSLYKTQSKTKIVSLVPYVSAINVCLRYYQLIKNFYPYNKVRVLILVKRHSNVNYEVLKSILDNLFNFAVSYIDDIDYDYTDSCYKHIIYGNNYMTNIQDKKQLQNWSVIAGKLLVR